jgi:rubrerythrin
MRRAITELEPYEVLKVAISIERRNTAIYQNYAQMFRGYDAEIERAFVEMAAEETRHEEELAALYRRKFGDLPCSVTDADVYEVVEAPILEDGEVFITDSMRVLDALRVALKAEQRAAFFYRQLTSLASDPDLYAVYSELARVEVGHEALLEAKLAEYESAAQG